MKQTKRLGKMGLPILAVLFIAGVVIAAGFMSGVTHINQTVNVAATITMNPDLNPAALRVGEDAEYHLTAVLTDKITTAKLTVNVFCAAGMASGKVVSNWMLVTFNGETMENLVLTSVDATHWQGFVEINSAGQPGGTVNAGSYLTGNNLMLQYGVAGSYVITATISGQYT